MIYFKYNMKELYTKIYINKDPDIYYIDNFLDISECCYIINKSKQKLQRALVSNHDKGMISNSRTGYNTWINYNNDNFLYKVCNKISDIVNMPLENSESIQVIYYNKTQEYKNHYDAYDFNNSETSKRCLSNGGQRILTALCYLNNVGEGGETNFPNLNKYVSPKRGRLVVFENTYKNTNIKHVNSLHAGMPVIEGQKYAFNLWFRENSVIKYN